MDSDEVILIEVADRFAVTWSEPADFAEAKRASEQADRPLSRWQGKVVALLANGHVVSIEPENLGNKDAAKGATPILGREE